MYCLPPLAHLYPQHRQHPLLLHGRRPIEAAAIFRFKNPAAWRSVLAFLGRKGLAQHKTKEQASYKVGDCENMTAGVAPPLGASPGSGAMTR